MAEPENDYGMEQREAEKRRRENSSPYLSRVSTIELPVDDAKSSTHFQFRF